MTCASALGAAPADLAGPHFRTAPPGAPEAALGPALRGNASNATTNTAFGAQLLTAEERAFIARLPEIRVAVAQPSFRPYEVIGEGGEISGIHAEMLVALAQTFGLRLRPVLFANWSDSMAAAQRGEVDLLMSMGLSPARAEQFEFTLGVTPMVSGVFARKAGPGVPPRPPLDHAVFAVQSSKMAGDYVKRQYPQARIVEVPSQALAFEAVATGTADYHVTDLLPALDRLARQPLPGIEVSQLVSFGSGHYHFALRKDWALLARILNKGLTSLRVAPSLSLAAPQSTLPADATTSSTTPSAATAAATAASAATAPTMMALTRHQQAVLWDFPVWRVGAVRGMRLLNEVDANGQHSGIGAEYVEAVARRLGVGLRVVPFDSVAAMLDGLRADRIDVVPLLTRTPGRAREFAYSSPYVEMPYMIVARHDAPLYWDLNSLRGKRLALALQHPLRELLAQRYADIHIVDVGGGPAAMDAVARGDADAAVEVKFVANLRIHADNDGHLRTVAAVGELPAAFHFATAPRAQALVPLIDQVLADIAPAERERMLRRWIAPEPVPSFPWRRHGPALLAALLALLALTAATLWWLQRLRREVRARRQAQMQLSDIEAALPCVAFRSRFDAQGGVLETHFSAGANRILGFEPDARKSLMQNIGPRLAADDLNALQAAQQRSLAQGDRIQVSGPYAHPDGHSRWLRSEVVSRREADGGSTLTGYLADVSAEHDLQQRLQQAAELRHLMLASASHELRAPTHTLSLALQALASDAVPAHQVQPLHDARAATDRLARRLNQLLDTARQDRADATETAEAGQGARQPQAAVSAPRQTCQTHQTRPIRHGAVLLCDDDEVSRELLAHMLMRHGYAVLHAAEGAAALALWQAGGVAALVTDMNMAGLSGAQLIQAIRGAESRAADTKADVTVDTTADATTDSTAAPTAATATAPAGHLPIVVCSGSELPPPAPATALGAVEHVAGYLHDAYLQKPVDIAQLVQTLQQLGLHPGPIP